MFGRSWRRKGNGNLTVCGVGVPEHDATERVVLLLRVRDVLRERRRAHVALAGRTGGGWRADVHLDVRVRRLGLRPLVPGGEVELGLVVQAAVVVVCRARRRNQGYEHGGRSGI